MVGMIESMSLPKKHIGLDFARLGRSLTLSGGRGLGLLLALLVLLAVSRSAVPIVADEIAPSKGGSAAAAAKRSIMDQIVEEQWTAEEWLAQLQQLRVTLQEDMIGDDPDQVFPVVLDDLEQMREAAGQEGAMLYLEQELAELSHLYLDGLLHLLRNHRPEWFIPQREEFVLEVVRICDRVRGRQWQARLRASLAACVPRLDPAHQQTATMIAAITCCFAASVMLVMMVGTALREASGNDVEWLK